MLNFVINLCQYHKIRKKSEKPVDKEGKGW